MSKKFILTDKGFVIGAKEKDLQPNVDRFREYLLDNIDGVNDVKVFEMTEEVRQKQLEAGIVGHTHLFVCMFEFGHHVLSIDARKRTTRGWKKNVEFVNKSYKDLLNKIIKEEEINL